MGLTKKDIEKLDKDNPIRIAYEQETGETVRGNPEHQLQKKAVGMFRTVWPSLEWRLYAVPNGGGRSKAEAGKLKAEGVLSGVWDLFLSVPRGGYAGAYIETKAGRNGLTDNQKRFREENRDDYYFFVYRDLDTFLENVKEYLEET